MNASPVASSLNAAAALVADAAAHAPAAALSAASGAAARSTARAVRDATEAAVELVRRRSAAGAQPPVSSAAARRRARASGYAAAASTLPASASAAKGSATAAKRSTAKRTSSGALAFLDDKNLSVEEKLLKLLAHLNAKWNTEIDRKLKEVGGTGASSSSPGSTSGAGSSAGAGSTRKSGLLGSLGGVLSDVLPAAGVMVKALQVPAVKSLLGQIGGPVLAAGATALGFPQAAPLLLRYGPQIVDAASSIAKLVDSPGAASGGARAGSSTSSGTSSGSATGTGGAGALSDSETQLRLTEIQRLMDKQKEMFSLVSNILRAGHDSRMAVIQNVR